MYSSISIIRRRRRRRLTARTQRAHSSRSYLGRLCRVGLRQAHPDMSSRPRYRKEARTGEKRPCRRSIRAPAAACGISTTKRIRRWRWRWRRRRRRKKRRRRRKRRTRKSASGEEDVLQYKHNTKKKKKTHSTHATRALLSFLPRPPLSCRLAPSAPDLSSRPRYRKEARTGEKRPCRRSTKAPAAACGISGIC